MKEKNKKIYDFYRSDPYQTYKIPLKTSGQSVIDHNLVTIYLNLEWPDNTADNPNILLHIFDKSKNKHETFRNYSYDYASFCLFRILSKTDKK